MNNAVSKDEIKECVIKKCELLLCDNEEYVELHKNLIKAYESNNFTAFSTYFNQLKNTVIITSYKMISNDIYILLAID